MGKFTDGSNFRGPRSRIDKSECAEVAFTPAEMQFCHYLKSTKCDYSRSNIGLAKVAIGLVRANELSVIKDEKLHWPEAHENRDEVYGGIITKALEEMAEAKRPKSKGGKHATPVLMGHSSNSSGSYLG